MDENQRQIDTTGKLILEILSKNNGNMKINELFDRVIAEDSLSEYEFRYSISSYLSSGKVEMGFDGIIKIK